MEEKSSPDVRIAHLAARVPRDPSGRGAAVPDVEMHSPVAGRDLAPPDDVLPVRRSERLSSALAEADRNDRWARLTLLGAALLEAALLGLTILLIDFGNRTHVLMFVLTMLTFMTLALGIVSLGARLSAANARVLKALELLDARPPVR